MALTRHSNIKRGDRIKRYNLIHEFRSSVYVQTVSGNRVYTLRCGELLSIPRGNVRLTKASVSCFGCISAQKGHQE